MNQPHWIELDLVLALHGEQIDEHGGSGGIRNVDGIESALAKPRHLFAYEQQSLFELAAAYAAGLSQNHGFMDGNKRTSFLTAYVFLYDNGFEISASQAEVAAAMLELAERKLTQKQLAVWLSENCEAIGIQQTASR
ncbi:MAG: type II toxin-antitoxin system death-on-curing family toxin [Bryobacteraceae bacterium]